MCEIPAFFGVVRHVFTFAGRKLVGSCQNGLIFARTNWRRAMKGQRQLDTKEERLAIADEIREFLNAAGQSRKVLIDQERHKLSESTVNKVFQGEFSERTLLMIESILGKSFGLRQNTDKADKAIGGYTLESVDAIEKHHLREIVAIE